MAAATAGSFRNDTTAVYLIPGTPRVMRSRCRVGDRGVVCAPGRAFDEVPEKCAAPSAADGDFFMKNFYTAAVDFGVE